MLMMSKMWLMVYHPFQRQNGGATLPDDIKDKLFITSLENIEYSILLETEARTMKWGWLFRTYMQWHALAFILSELCHRTRGELVERAWVAVDKSRDGRWGELRSDGRSGHLWKPLMRLVAKAKAAHNQALKEDGMSIDTPSTTDSQEAYPPGSTVELLAAMKNQPRRMVQAPLSQAQLERFHPPPVFGDQPRDSTKLLQSPVLSDTTLIDEPEAMDSSVFPPAPLQSSYPMNISYMGQKPQTNPISAQQQQQQQQHNWFPAPNGSITADMNMATINISNPSYDGFSFSDNVQQHQSPNNNNPMPTTFEQRQPSLFENGQVDWADWDNLVRQFGMDVDQPQALGGQQVYSQWTGGPGLANYGNLSGSDWF